MCDLRWPLTNTTSPEIYSHRLYPSFKPSHRANGSVTDENQLRLRSAANKTLPSRKP